MHGENPKLIRGMFPPNSQYLNQSHYYFGGLKTEICMRIYIILNNLERNIRRKNDYV